MMICRISIKLLFFPYQNNFWRRLVSFTFDCKWFTKTLLILNEQMATGGKFPRLKQSKSETKQRSNWQRSVSSEKDDALSLTSFPNDIRINNWVCCVLNLIKSKLVAPLQSWNSSFNIIFFINIYCFSCFRSVTNKFLCAYGLSLFINITNVIVFNLII